ncbi:hypothetical protein Tco_0969363 [Tanacetum coccineum]
MDRSILELTIPVSGDYLITGIERIHVEIWDVAGFRTSFRTPVGYYKFAVHIVEPRLVSEPRVIEIPDGYLTSSTPTPSRAEAFWGADYEGISEGGIPRYIPLEDDHEFPAEEQPLPPIDSPTAESPGYITESDPEEDPEGYEDDETEDGPVDYPMDGGDDGDDDDGDSSRDDAGMRMRTRRPPPKFITSSTRNRGGAISSSRLYYPSYC